MLAFGEKLTDNIWELCIVLNILFPLFYLNTFISEASVGI